MVRNNGCFEEKSRSESLKVCGNCRRVHFINLTEADVALLVKMVRFHGVSALCRWAKMKHVKSPGGHSLDPDKTRVGKLVRENSVY